MFKRLLCALLGHEHKHTRISTRFMFSLGLEHGTAGYCLRCNYEWNNLKPGDRLLLELRDRPKHG